MEGNILHNKKEFDRMRSILLKDPHLKKERYKEEKDYDDKTSYAIATFRNKVNHEKITLRYERK